MTTEPEFHTRTQLDRSGLAVFAHIIRGPEDPERSPREARKGQETAWRKSTAASTRPDWVERIAALKYGLSDIRSLLEGDMRFLRQF